MYIGLLPSICLLINSWYIARSKGGVGTRPRLENRQGYLALPVSQQQNESERGRGWRLVVIYATEALGPDPSHHIP